MTNPVLTDFVAAELKDPSPSLGGTTSKCRLTKTRAKVSVL